MCPVAFATTLICLLILRGRVVETLMCVLVVQRKKNVGLM